MIIQLSTLKTPLNRGEFHPRQIFHVLCIPAKHRDPIQQTIWTKVYLDNCGGRETSAVSQLIV